MGTFTKKEMVVGGRRLRRTALRLESLEERTLLAVYAGFPPAPTGDDASTVVTTLADVVDDSDGLISLREAIENAKVQKTDVTFQVAGTINLTLGQLEISSETVIHGEGITINAGGASRVFNITGNATLTGLTITGGSVTDANGGGLNATGCSLTMTNCVVTGNTAKISGGLNLNNTTATIVNSVFSNNTAINDGGVMQIYFSTLNAVNTLFTNNSGRDGGAILNYHGKTTLTNCTITGNTGSRNGGGIWNGGSSSSLVLNNTIVVNNEAPAGQDIQAAVAMTLNNSLYQKARCAGSISVSNCLEYTEEMILFVNAASGNYALADGSDAINAGNNKHITTETDLAGNPRIVSGRVDIGAYENQNYVTPVEESSPVVTTIDDVVDPYDGYISLREAIGYAGSEETVSFSNTLYTYSIEAGEWLETDSRTILLQTGSLSIAGKTEIVANLLDRITVDAGGAFRVFDITGNATLTGLTVTGGSVVDGNGGGLNVTGGSLTMTNCVVTGNTAKISGGLNLNNATATIVNSVFSNNTAINDGGVMQIYFSTLNAVNTLFTNNSGRDGGAILNYHGKTTLTNCTITGNTGSRNGGGIWNGGSSSSLVLNNTIVVKNEAPTAQDIQANIAMTLNNSVYQAARCAGEINVNSCLAYTDGMILFADAASGDYTLADDSGAINAGNNQYITAETDLAGNPRIVRGRVDIGAYENQTIPVVPTEDPSSVVTTIDDVVDPYDGYISLREAITYAGTDQAVTFADVLYTYDLESRTWSSTDSRAILLQTGSLSIAGKTEIMASPLDRITIDAGGAFRVFDITGNATLTGLMITGGSVTDGNGGGLNVIGGSLTMANCVVTGNTAKISGGLNLNNATATIVNSVFSNNTAINDGGVMQNYHSTLNAINTLFGNNSGRGGGAILNYHGTMTLTNCTVTGNTATGNADTGKGGGIWNAGSTSSLVLNNTIVVKNEASAGRDIQADVAMTLNNSIYQKSYCVGEITANDCVTYTSSKVLFTNADAEDYTLASGSIAINAGNLDSVGYGFDLAGNERIQGSTVDIGAYEANGAKWNINRVVNGTAKTIVYTVNSLKDEVANDGLTTLREAVLYANGDNAVDYEISIIFDAALSEGTVNLTGGELVVSNRYAIDAGKLSNGITIDAGGVSRVFDITGNAILTGLTITGGSVADGNGGGLNVTGGSLTMTDCVVTGNTAKISGGLNMNSATATIVNSVFSNNTAINDGGVMQNYRSTLNAVNTLFVNNSGRDGGAILNYHGTMTLTNCTITGNTATGKGGGIWHAGSGSLVLNNAIVVKNEASEAQDIQANIAMTLNNSVYQPTRSAGEINVNSCLEYSDEMLLFVDAAGGDYALANGSAAINAGNNDVVTTETDLAGNPRIIDEVVDMGAYENQEGGTSEQLAAPAISTGKGVYVSYGANRHLLQWGAVDNASGYELAYSADGSTWTTVETTETSAVVCGLTYGANMTYRVRALGDGASYTDSDWSASKTFNVCPMDINNDEDVSGGDRTLLAQAWLSEEGEDNYRNYADINGDGDVGGADRAYLSNNWLLNVEDDADDLQYPPAHRADAIFAEFDSADLGVDLDVF